MLAAVRPRDDRGLTGGYLRDDPRELVQGSAAEIGRWDAPPSPSCYREIDSWEAGQVTFVTMPSGPAHDRADGPCVPGYMHPSYARSHEAFGTPRELPRCKGRVIERAIPGFAGSDAT